ncbi:MAG: antirestriction protein ArdA [Nakamurella sp.]
MTNEGSRPEPRLRLVDASFRMQQDEAQVQPVATEAPEHDELPVEHPKLLIGSAADHTSISEHAVWIDATLEVDDIREAIREMLETSPALQAAGKADGTGAWIIHDYLGFGIYEMYEDDQLEVAHELALGIQQHGEAFSGWAEIHHADRSRWADFPAAYLGTYDRMARQNRSSRPGSSPPARAHRRRRTRGGSTAEGRNTGLSEARRWRLGFPRRNVTRTALPVCAGPPLGPLWNCHQALNQFIGRIIIERTRKDPSVYGASQ